MEEEINILDYVKVIMKWKQFIISFIAIAVTVTVLFCLMTPWKYRARTTILLPSQSDSGIENIVALSSLMSGTAQSNPAGISQSLVGRTRNFPDILRSKTIALMIVDGLALDKYYKVRNKEVLIPYIQKSLKVQEKKGILTIFATDKDPRLAADIANYAVMALAEFNKKGNMQFARRFKNFLNEQVAVAKVDLANAEENLKKFDTQSQMVKISQKELMLSRYMRDVKVKEAIYSMLLQEYEKAQIEEAKEELYFEVLDPAYPSRSPYSPKPFLYSVIAVILGGLAAVSLAFIFEYLEGIGVKIPELDYNKEIEWQNIKRS